MSTAAPVASPVLATYRLAAPSGWWKRVLRPLTATLRAILPRQAQGQRAVALGDKKFTLRTDAPNGWRVELEFDGPALAVALLPPGARDPDPPDPADPGPEATPQTAG